MRTLAVIPARYQSSRFPGKPLVDIAGQSMLQRVYKQALKCDAIDSVIVATDDKRIYDHCTNEQMEVIMTSGAHQSGTDRVAEVVASRNEEIIINIQGDEPFIPPGHIGKLCDLMENRDTRIGTLVTPIRNEKSKLIASVVKVVLDNIGQALYFSRSTIPFERSKDDSIIHYRHLGIYSFTRECLLELAALPAGMLEKAEMLEQLRWLEAGYKINTAQVDHVPIAIDTPADLDELLQWMNINNQS